MLLSRKSKESSKRNYNYNIIGFDNYEAENNNVEDEYMIIKNNNNENNGEIKFDLWPNYLERKFYDDKEEIPLPGTKEGEYNQLDFIENKKEYNESEEEEESKSKSNKIRFNDFNNINNEDNEENENEEEDQ